MRATLTGLGLAPNHPRRLGTGTASVSLAGWTLNDFQGSPNLRSESPSRWAFPATASIAAGQVLILARQAAQFRMVFPAARVAYEIEPGNMDDMGVPNLTRTGTANFALANAATGDGLVLRDGMGVIVDGVEFRVLAADDRKILRLRVTALAPQHAEESK